VQLPGDYAEPRGALLLALGDTQVAGCAALRPLDADTCEIKRVFVRPAQRGRGTARAMLAQLIAHARRADYREARLETLPAMREAISLYTSLGFVPIAPYSDNTQNEVLAYGYTLR
jgi:ribosomal protein S18 acetylase RimI-like enzyme